LGGFNLKAMKTLNLSDIKIELFAEVDDSPIESSFASGDENLDRLTIEAINKELQMGNIWAWALVEVRGTYKGLSASDYLGACSYKNEDEFKADAYYEDMCKNVLDEINSQVKDIVNSVLPCECEKINEIIRQQYPIQDEHWPSRRWNAEHTDYVDMSGCDC
jgi:hypothetical protein